MPYEGKESGGGSDFVLHPPGRFNGIIYGFKDYGLKENPFGNVERRCHFAIECLDEFLEDGKPHAAFIFFNMKWGNMKATGKMRPQFQQVREVLLGRKITDKDEWTSFDENDFLGMRVRYRCTEGKKQDGSPKIDTEILEPLDDQELGEMYNEPTVTKEEDGEDLPF